MISKGNSHKISHRKDRKGCVCVYMRARMQKYDCVTCINEYTYMHRVQKRLHQNITNRQFQIMAGFHFFSIYQVFFTDSTFYKVEFL